MLSGVFFVSKFARLHIMRLRGAGLVALACAAFFAPAFAAPDNTNAGCKEQQWRGTDYVVCRFNGDADIRLFLNDSVGEPYKHFNFVNQALAEKGERLAFAMNAGMYHEDRTPVGLFIEGGVQQTAINTNEGPGNFHLLPNGVFFQWREDGYRGAYVMESERYESKMAHDVVAYATQSGPMLVIGNEIHPRFLPDSDSLKRRNGVGVTEEGDVYFVLADTPVRFYDFAMFFKQELKTPNALYLDGTISRLYAPELDRNDPGVAMGPIVGVVVSDD